MIADMLAKSSQAGAEALLANTRTPAEATQSQSFSGLPETFQTQKNYGADLFKRNATEKVTTSDLDQQIEDNKTRKFQIFADIVKYAKANNIATDPKTMKTMADQAMATLDTQNTNLQTEKMTRISEAQKGAEEDYSVLKNDFIYQRQRQMQLDKDVMNESTQPSSNPQKITDLMKEKEQVDKKVEGIKKQFKANGIEQPEAILRQESNEQKQQSLPDAIQAPHIDKVLYDVGLGKYDDADGTFNAKSFITETQKLPEFQGLPKKALAEKLISMDADIPALEDLFYVANSIQDKPDSMVPVLKQKGFTDEQIAQIVLNGFAKNANLKTLVSGDPADPKAQKQFIELQKSLKAY